MMAFEATPLGTVLRSWPLETTCPPSASILQTKDQFAYWRDGLCDTIGLTVEREAPLASPFDLKASHVGTETVMWNKIQLSTPGTLGSGNAVSAPTTAIS